MQLIRQGDGMFRAKGLINGVSVNFLVDTGATVIAMNHSVANRVRIPYRTQGRLTKVETASGITDAYKVNLATVRVGDIELKNVEAVVIVGAQPSSVLLGMSFLSRLQMKQEGTRLTLSRY
nr:TIGR02281 family clan AA aspartic protease [Pleionea sp. CnH1-48]